MVIAEGSFEFFIHGLLGWSSVQVSVVEVASASVALCGINVESSLVQVHSA